MTSTEPVSHRTITRDRLLRKRGLPDLAEARRQLIEFLRRTGHPPESVLWAMSEVPRHAFAPVRLWRLAYADTELSGPDAFLPRPGAVAQMVSALAGAGKVLEYATGTGYVTSVLALVAGHVDTVEHDPWQLWLSSDAFRELGIDNISQKASDGRLGWPERAPYDGIAVCAAMPRLLDSFVEQLADGGVLVAPIGPFLGPHRLIRADKSAQGLTITDLGRCYFPPLTGVWGLASQAIPQPQGQPFASTLGTGFWEGPEMVLEGDPLVSPRQGPELSILEALEGELAQEGRPGDGSTASEETTRGREP